MRSRRTRGAAAGGAAGLRRLFPLALVVVPLAVLALLEGVLALAGVAEVQPLFEPHKLARGVTLQLNPRIGERFFPPSLRAIMPAPSFQILPPAKPPATRRILCLGESTTAGFPFPDPGSFPSLLRILLEERSPPGGEGSGGWEVVNLGLTAISSSTIVSLMDEILAVDPDVLVVYLGHNEFYGAGGSASVGTWVGRSAGWLRSIRIGRALEALLARPSSGPDDDGGVEGADGEAGTLMARMVRDADVPLDDPARDRAYRRFAASLDGILGAARRKGVRAVLCEVASNEADHYPFGSRGAADVASLARGPLGALDQAVARDSTHAGLRWLRGAARRAAGLPGGEHDLRAARNLDTVPFRAPDPINEIIRAAAARHGASLVPIDRILREAAPGGAPGSESFVEHLHPTFLGNSRIASAVADVLLDRPISPVAPADAGRWLRKSGLTRFDLAAADGRIAQLSARWPYARTGAAAPPVPYRARSVREEAAALLEAAGEPDEASVMRRRSPEEERLVQALLRRRTNHLEAHKQLARGAAARGDLGEAARHYEACVRFFPVDYTLWMDLADLRVRMGDRARAERAARSALLWNPYDARATALLRASK